MVDMGITTPAPVSSMQLRAGSQKALVQLYEHGPHIQRWYGFVHPSGSVIRHQSCNALVKRGLARLIGRHAHRRLQLTARGKWYASTIALRRAVAVAQASDEEGLH